MLYRPVDGLDDDICRAGTAEYAHLVQVCKGGDAGANGERHARRGRIVGTGEGGSGRRDPEPGDGSGRMAAVTIAVQRVGVRHGGVLGRILGAGIVVVAYQVRAALHFRRIRTEQCRIGGSRARRGGGRKGSRGAWTAEVRMREIDPRVEVGDFDVLAM